VYDVDAKGASAVNWKAPKARDRAKGDLLGRANVSLVDFVESGRDADPSHHILTLITLLLLPPHPAHLTHPAPLLRAVAHGLPLDSGVQGGGQGRG
jgi:hypothetical protein